MTPRTSRTRVRPTVDDSALARSIGARIRRARHAAGLTQQQLAGERYTKAYISALETGIVKPSMAALNYLAERLSLPATHFLADPDAAWSRLGADLSLASGRWQEAADTYARLLDGQSDRLSRAGLLRGLAEALCRLDRGREAIGAATEAAETFSQAGRTEDAARATYWLAYGHFLAENSSEARSLFLGLLGQIRGGLHLDEDTTVRVLVALSAVVDRDGDQRASLAYLEEARALATDLDDRRRATLLSSLASSHLNQGDFEAAIRYGLQSLALFRAADAELESAMLENILALSYLDAGSATRAAELAASARERFARLSDERWLAHVTDTEAQIALVSGNLAQAAELAERAVALSEASGDRKALLTALSTQARTQSAAGRLDLADATWARAAEATRAHGSRLQLQEVLGAWADTLALLGHHQRAYELTREALTAGR